MQKIGFAEALDSIVASDPRYQREAYVFLRDALDFTTKQQKKVKGATVRHVSGPELLQGVRELALREFGFMARTVFHMWGIQRTDDFGQIVFNLVESNLMSKTDNDSMADFHEIYDLDQALQQDYRIDLQDAD